MIPIVSTMVVGSQAKPRRAFFLSLSYVLAMAGTYAAVGVAAGLAGANLQATAIALAARSVCSLVPGPGEFTVRPVRACRCPRR